MIRTLAAVLAALILSAGPAHADPTARPFISHPNYSGLDVVGTYHRGFTTFDPVAVRLHHYKPFRVTMHACRAIADQDKRRGCWWQTMTTYHALARAK